VSFKDIKHILDFLVPKHLLATTVNGTNYLLWTPSFRLFVGSQKKLKHLTKNPPTIGTTAYNDGVASDCSMMTWLFSNMDEKISATIMFLKTAKEI